MWLQKLPIRSLRHVSLAADGEAGSGQTGSCDRTSEIEPAGWQPKQVGVWTYHLFLKKIYVQVKWGINSPQSISEGEK